MISGGVGGWSGCLRVKVGTLGVLLKNGTNTAGKQIALNLCKPWVQIGKTSEKVNKLWKLRRDYWISMP